MDLHISMYTGVKIYTCRKNTQSLEQKKGEMSVAVQFRKRRRTFIPMFLLRPVDGEILEAEDKHPNKLMYMAETAGL